VKGGLTIVAALHGEIAPLLAAAGTPVRLRGGGTRWVEGRLGGERVTIAVTGDGARAAERGLAEVLAEVAPDALLIVGVAGGLSPELACGDLVAGSRLLGKGALAPDSDWTARLAADPRVRPGTVVSAAEILLDPAAKQRLWQASGAPAPAVVDLESATYAAVASGRGVPFAVLRAVLDPVSETLPLDLNRCLGRDGRVSGLRVVARAAAHPPALPALWDLRRRLRRCAERLAEVVWDRLAEPLAATGQRPAVADAWGEG
jgi:nucleoside phosphorylase